MGRTTSVRLVCVCCALLATLPLLGQIGPESAESRPAQIVALAARLAALEHAEPNARWAALLSVKLSLDAATQGVDLGAETAPSSMPESRAARIAVAKQAIAMVAVRLPLISSALGDPDAAVRCRAAGILRRMGEAGRPALVSLFPLLDDPDAGVRNDASGAIADIGPEDAACVSLIAPGLTSADANVRQNVAWALYRMGPSAAPAVNGLITTLSDERVDTRVNAAKALGAIGREARPALDALMVSARESRPPVRQNAIWAVRNIIAAFRALSAGRSPGLASEDYAFMTEAGRRLGSLVKVLLDDPDADVREQAAWALGTVRNEDSKAAIQALLRALPAANPGGRAAIVWALAQIGPETEDAAAPLAAVLRDPNPEVRQDAAYALFMLGPKAKVAVPELIKALSDERSKVRINAAAALGEIGIAASDAAPALLVLLDSDDIGLWYAAAHAVHAVSPDSDAALPRLIGHLDSKDEEARSLAAYELCPYGPRARAALPALVRMLAKDRTRSGAREAVDALLAIDRTGKAAIPAICDLIEAFRPSFVDEIPDWIREYGAAARAEGPRLAKAVVATRDYWLMDALVDLKVDPKDLIPALEAVLAKRVEDVPEFPYRLFVRADPSGDLAISALVRLLGHPEHAVRSVAAWQLAPFGPKAKAAIPALLKTFRNPAGTGRKAPRATSGSAPCRSSPRSDLRRASRRRR